MPRFAALSSMLTVSLMSAAVFSAWLSIAILHFFMNVLIFDFVAKFRSLRSRDFLTSLITDLIFGN